MSAAEELVIILPHVVKLLQPNCTVATMGMRMAKAGAIKKQRKRTVEAIKRERCESLPWKKCHVHADFYFATNLRRDVDNANGSLKSTYDGIVDAGVVLDDTPEFMVRDMSGLYIDKMHPRVELTITRIA